MCLLPLCPHAQTRAAPGAQSVLGANEGTWGCSDSSKLVCYGRALAQHPRALAQRKQRLGATVRSPHLPRSGGRGAGVEKNPRKQTGSRWRGNVHREVRDSFSGRLSQGTPCCGGRLRKHGIPKAGAPCFSGEERKVGAAGLRGTGEGAGGRLRGAGRGRFLESGCFSSATENPRDKSHGTNCSDYSCVLCWALLLARTCASAIACDALNIGGGGGSILFPSSLYSQLG